MQVLLTNTLSLGTNCQGFVQADGVTPMCIPMGAVQNGETVCFVVVAQVTSGPVITISYINRNPGASALAPLNTMAECESAATQPYVDLYGTQLNPNGQGDVCTLYVGGITFSTDQQQLDCTADLAAGLLPSQVCSKYNLLDPSGSTYTWSGKYWKVTALPGIL